MSSKAWRPDRCGLCGKKPDHPLHRVEAPLPWWRKLLRLAWPRWMWGSGEGRHLFLSKARQVAASDKMAEIKLKLKRRKHNG